jgi:hypothetical protein
VKYARHQQKEIGPKMTKPVNEIPALDPAKKRGQNNNRENQQKEANKDQKGIDREQGLYKLVYITHIIEANVTRICCL